MRTILVTGGCGFIGSNFIQIILEKFGDIKIVNIDKLTYAGNPLNNIKLDNHRYTMVKGDICNSTLLTKLFDKYKFSQVINFAAESHVDRSINSSAEFINTNIIGVYNILEVSRDYYSNSNNKDFKFIHISTDEVFGSLGEFGSFDEDSPYDPSSPYSASKASSDHLVRAWHKTYGLPVIITNCSNNYGPYQFPEKLIPLMIINAINNKMLPVYGKGENVRDWIYVDDHCKAIIDILEKGKIGSTYIIGSNNEIKNIDIVKVICKTMDELLPRKDNSPYSDLIEFVKDRPGHDLRYAVNSEKIKTELNWTPKESFDTGILKTIKWYLNNRVWWKSILDNTYQQERLGVFGE